LQKWLLESFFFTGETEIDMLECIFKTLGTPNSETWPGLDRHSFYKAFPFWKAVNLSTRVPKLEKTGLDVLSGLLRLDPISRITARTALCMPYFDKISVSRVLQNHSHLNRYKSLANSKFRGKI